MASDEKFKISGLNAALDEYLEKIDKVNLSRKDLLANKELLEDSLKLLASLDDKMKTIESSSASSSEKSARLALLDSIRSNVMSGKPVDSLLTQESRVSDLARRGSGAASFPRISSSERVGLLSVSERVAAAGLGSTLGGLSPRQIDAMLSWATRSGGGPSRSGMSAALQSSAFELGSGLTSGGTWDRLRSSSDDHLIDSLDEAEREEKFDQSVSTIQTTSDAILASLGKPTKGAPARLEPRQAKPSKSGRGDWWSTLKLLGGIAGTVGVLYGLFSNQKVQQWLNDVLLNPDKWKEWGDKIDAIWNRLGDVFNLVMSSTKSTRDATIASANAGYELYKSMDSDLQGYVNSFNRDVGGMQPMRVLGLSDIDRSVAASGVDEALSAAAKLGFGALGAGVVLKKGLSALYAGGPASAAALALFSIKAWSEIKETQRKTFNIVSAAWAVEHGLAAAYLFTEGSGSSPSLVALGKIEDASGTTSYDSLSPQEQMGYSTSLLLQVESERQRSNSYALLSSAFSSNPAMYAELVLGKSGLSADVARGELMDWLSKSSPEERRAFLAQHPEIYRMITSGNVGIELGRPADYLGRADGMYSHLYFNTVDSAMAASAQGYEGGESDPAFVEAWDKIARGEVNVAPSGSGLLRTADMQRQYDAMRDPSVVGYQTAAAFNIMSFFAGDNVDAWIMKLGMKGATGRRASAGALADFQRALALRNIRLRGGDSAVVPELQLSTFLPSIAGSVQSTPSSAAPKLEEYVSASDLKLDALLYKVDTLAHQLDVLRESRASSPSSSEGSGNATMVNNNSTTVIRTANDPTGSM